MQPESTTPTGDQVPAYDRSPPGPRWRDRLAAGAICLVIGIAGGFALGRTTAPSGPKTLAEAVQQAQQGKLPRGNIQGLAGAFRPGQGGQNGQNQPGQGGPFGGRDSLQAEIAAIVGDVLALSTAAGELKVQLSGSTQIRKAVSAKQGDLAVGDTVAVRLDPATSSGGNGTAAASSITKEPAQ